MKSIATLPRLSNSLFPHQSMYESLLELWSDHPLHLHHHFARRDSIASSKISVRNLDLLAVLCVQDQLQSYKCHKQIHALSSPSSRPCDCCGRTRNSMITTMGKILMLYMPCFVAECRVLSNRPLERPDHDKRDKKEKETRAFPYPAGSHANKQELPTARLSCCA
jgi:hypothetical protein